MRYLIVGGCKSGKSNSSQTLACTLGREHYYWATMIPGDDEDLERVRKHVEYRKDMGFKTIECGRGIRAFADSLPYSEKEALKRGTVVFDSLTAWLANEMFDEYGCHKLNDEMIEHIMSLSRIPENFICTADEMWRDISYSGWTEEYRKALAKICNIMAAEFDVVCEVAAGRKHFFKGSF